MKAKFTALSVCCAWGLAANAAETPDAHIANTIHATNLMEIHVGELAQSKGTMKGVKEYGSRLVKDHEKAEKQLTAFASKHNMTLADPTPMNDQERADDQSHKELMSKLQTLTGADFDREFSQSMEKGHAQAIAMLTTAEKDSAVSADLKGLIAKILPTLKHHEKIAANLTQKVTGSAR